MAEAYCGESMVANALIDVERLREARRKPAMTNMLARQRLDLFSSAYQKHARYPSNNLLSEDGDVTVPDRNHFMSQQQAVIDQLVDEGLI